jgi:iron complex transport system substrate-binding protein
VGIKNLGGDKKKKMKTKKKLLAMVEIAIVLCSVFLVAVPAIVAQEQNQEMQKVSATTITTASEDGYVLEIYGNANEDDTVDMRDLTYVKLIFFGKKPETELADAKYDGKINPLDFIQIKLIIVGKEKELTIVDSADRIVTVNKPVKRIVVLRHSAEVVRMLGAKDKIVGVSTYVKDDIVFFPELSKLPSVGSVFDPATRKAYKRARAGEAWLYLWKNG